MATIRSLAEEHVLGAAQADALGAELAGLGGVRRGVGVGADLERADLVGPAPSAWRSRRRSSGSTVGTWPIMTSPVVPSIVRKSPALTTWPSIVTVPAFSSILIASQPTTQGLPQPRATTAAWLALPPVAVRMPLARCMPATSSGLVSLRTSRIGSSGCCSACSTAASAERTTLPRRGAGAGGDPLRDRLDLGLRVELRQEQVVEAVRVDPLDGGRLVDQPLLDHLDGDPHGGGAGPLAGAGLEHVERAVLRP